MIGWFNHCGLIDHWNVDHPEYLMSKTASFEKSKTPEEIVFEKFGYSVPLPSKIDGYDFLWNETFIVNDVDYPGIFAKAFIKENDIQSFTSFYRQELVNAGYTLNSVQVDDEGDSAITKINMKGITLIQFYDPLKMVYDNGTYYYTLIYLVDLSSSIE